MRILAALGLILLVSSPLTAEVEVRIAGERVSVRAVSAPVSEVLDKLARQTGMRVSYDASPPRQTLTATLEDRAPAEVVLAVLEGLGLNYALVMDRSGARVDQLLILGSLSAAPGRSAAASSPAPRPTPPAQEGNSLAELGLDVPEEGEEEEDDVQLLEQLETAQREEGEPAVPAQADRPAPPQYPSSSFTPKLPLPTPAPSASPTPAPPRQ